MADETALVTKPNTKIFFGVVFDVNGQEVALEPTTALDKIKEDGIECRLPAGNKVSLGRVGESINQILESFGTTTTIPETEEEIDETLPDIAALKASYKKWAEAELAIESFHVKLPGAKANKALKAATKDLQAEAPTLYTIGLSATWPTDNSTDSGIVGSLTLKGIYLKVSNE